MVATCVVHLTVNNKLVQKKKEEKLPVGPRARLRNRLRFEPLSSSSGATTGVLAVPSALSLATRGSRRVVVGCYVGMVATWLRHVCFELGSIVGS
jgi:hypothetical protein